MSSNVADFNARNRSLTAKLLQQGYRYYKLLKTFFKFYRRHYELVSKFNVGLNTLLHQGLSEPILYTILVYKLKKKKKKKKKWGRLISLISSEKNSICYKRIGHNINIMWQSACLVINPITVNNFASFFNRTPVGRASDSMIAPARHKAIYFSWLGPKLFFLPVAWPTGVQLLVFFYSSVPVVFFDIPGISRCRSQHVVTVESHLCFVIVFICDLFVSRDDPLMS